MAQAPDQIRHDIEATRSDLARDVDALADRTMPNRVARRRWDGMKNRVRGVGQKVMGTPRDKARMMQDRAGGAAGTAQEMAHRAGDTASQAASKATETARHTPEAVQRQTQGNPLAVGMMAFGAGLLAATLIPETESEKRAGGQLKEQASGVADQVTGPLAESAQQIKEDVSGSVRHAGDQVRQTATEAARTTGQQTTSSARDATEQTRRAARDMT